MQNNLTYRNNWALWLSCLAVLGAFFIQYRVDFGHLLRRWASEDFSYCYLVPLLFLYSVYANRASLRSRAIRSSRSGFFVLLLSGLFYLGGKLGSMETLVYMAIWIAAVGMGLLVLGTDVVRALAFPFLILAFIVPVPPFLNELLTFKLKLLSSSLAEEMMRMAGLSVFRQGNIIDIGVTQLQVVEACSGLRYIYPLLVMGMAFAYLFHGTWWSRSLIVLFTIPASIFSNALRIAITGYLTIHVSPEVAEGFFHGFSGWLIFMLSLLFLTLLSLIMRRLERVQEPHGPRQIENAAKGTDNPVFSNIKLSPLWIASLMFLAFYGLNAAIVSGQITPPRKGFDEFPTVIGEWKGQKLAIAQDLLESSLWADDYVMIRFMHQNTGDALLLFVPYYNYQGTMHTAHSPVSCLVGGGYALQSRKPIVRNLPEPVGDLTIVQMLLERDRQLVLSNYWFQQRGRVIVSEYWNKVYLFWDSMMKRRTDGALVRMEMPLRPGQDVEKAQRMMDAFTTEMMKILPEYVPG